MQKSFIKPVWMIKFQILDISVVFDKIHKI